MRRTAAAIFRAVRKRFLPRGRLLRDDGPKGEYGQGGQEVPEVLADPGGRGREPVLVDEQDAEEKEGQRADEDVPDEGERFLAPGPPFGQGQGDGHAHDEQESGEDDVGQGEDVLVGGGVPEEERDGLHPGDVIDEDHGQDVEAAEGVEASESFPGRHARPPFP